MTSVYERATRSLDEPVAESNPATLVIELAAAQVEVMLQRSPLSPATTEKYLKQLAEILASHRPELDFRRVAMTVERAENPADTTVRLAKRPSRPIIKTLRQVPEPKEIVLPPTPERHTKAKAKADAEVRGFKRDRSKNSQREDLIPKGVILDTGPLTRGEVEVAYLLSSGYTLEEIVKILDVPLNTLRSRLKAVGRKLDLPYTTQAYVVAECLRQKFMTPPPDLLKYKDFPPLIQEQITTIFYLSYGFSRADIAKQMKCPEGTVKSRIEWAARHLRVKNSQPLLVAIAYINNWVE